MTFPYGVPAVVHRPSTTSRRGDPATTVSHAVDGCAFAPETSVEVVDGRDTVITRWVLYAPYGADILAIDEVVDSGGKRWQVDGSPEPWQSPFTGWRAGMRVALKEVTG